MPEELRFVSLDKIDLPDIDVRRVRDPEYVEKLKESIRRHGILQAILLRRKGDRYEVIAGTTRALIARELNLPKYQLWSAMQTLASRLYYECSKIWKEKTLTRSRKRRT